MTAGDCIFCAIVAGEAPASFVYQADDHVAFMDIAPANRGHVLIIPTAHATYLADMPTETGNRLFATGMKITAAVRASGLRCEGVNLFLADGEAAGQEVFHVHLHVIPRFRGDQVTIKAVQEVSARSDLNDDAEGIRRQMPA
ncbi:MAG: HIT domain-containing protein [Dehalococcoidia bacterium]